MNEDVNESTSQGYYSAQEPGSFCLDCMLWLHGWDTLKATSSWITTSILLVQPQFQLSRPQIHCFWYDSGTVLNVIIYFNKLIRAQIFHLDVRVP